MIAQQAKINRYRREYTLNVRKKSRPFHSLQRRGWKGSQRRESQNQQGDSGKDIEKQWDEEDLPWNSKTTSEDQQYEWNCQWDPGDGNGRDPPEELFRPRGEMESVRPSDAVDPPEYQSDEYSTKKYGHADLVRPHHEKHVVIDSHILFVTVSPHHRVEWHQNIPYWCQCIVQQRWFFGCVWPVTGHFLSTYLCFGLLLHAQPSHPDGTLDIPRLVPEYRVCNNIEQGVSSCHEFELCNGETATSTSSTLRQEPSRLKNDEGLGHRVTFTPVLDLGFTNNGIFDLLCLHEPLDISKRKHLLAIVRDEASHGRKKTMDG